MAQEYTRLDNSGLIYLVNYIFQKLKNSPLATDTTYTFTQDNQTGEYVLTEKGTGEIARVKLADNTHAGLMSGTDFMKLGTIESNAEVNKIQAINVNGDPLIPDEQTRAVDINILTKEAVEKQITDKKYLTEEDVTKLINTKTDGLKSLTFKVVASYDQLPETGEESVIYMIPNTDAATNSTNKYTEYVWLVDEKRYEEWAPEHVNLSGYVKSSELTTIQNTEIQSIVDDAYADVFLPLTV